jgi:hypothetical protein
MLKCSNAQNAQMQQGGALKSTPKQQERWTQQL